MSDPIYTQLRGEILAAHNRLREHTDELKELLPYHVGDVVHHPTTKQPMTVTKIKFSLLWDHEWPDEPRWLIFGLAHKQDGSPGKRELQFVHYTES